MSQIVELMGGRALTHGIALQVDRSSGNSNKKMYVGGQAHANTADGSVVGPSTTAESLMESYNIPAGTLVAGSTIRFRASTHTIDQGGDDLTMRFRLGNNNADSDQIVFTSAAVTQADNDGFFIDGVIQVRTVGTGGTAVAMFSYQDPDVPGTAPKFGGSPSFAINTEAAGGLYLTMSGTWDGSHTDNKVKSTMFIVDLVNPV